MIERWFFFWFHSILSHQVQTLLLILHLYDAVTSWRHVMTSQILIYLSQLVDVLEIWFFFCFHGFFRSLSSKMSLIFHLNDAVTSWRHVMTSQNLIYLSQLVDSSSSSFVCSLNPIRQTFIPQPLFHYSIILSPWFFVKVSEPIRFSCAHTCLLNRNKAKQRLSPCYAGGRSQSRTRIIGPIPSICEFRMKRKETDCSVKKRNWK